MNNLIIIGFKSAGKTTLGRQVACKLQKPFIDTDDFFQQPPSYLYQKLGADLFRAEEKKHLQSLITLKGYIIATGGGVVSDPDNGRLLRELGTVVHLQTPKEIIRSRIFLNKLPAFLEDEIEPETRFEELYQLRLGIYTAIAHHSIITEDELWEVIRSDPFSV